MPKAPMRPVSAVLLAAGLLIALTASATAHPHVWITVETTVLYDRLWTEVKTH